MKPKLPASDPVELEQLREIDSISDEFEFALHGGESPRIEDYLPRVAAGARGRLLNELLRLELEWQQRMGVTITPNAYLQRFPGEGEIVRGALSSIGAAPAALQPPTVAAGDTQPASRRGVFPACPGRLGKFELERSLGEGGFGAVFLATDTQLGRKVALKIPRVNEGNRRFQTEARSAAKLRHPNIVAVHECGEQDGWLYIVNDLIDGADLATTIRYEKLSLRRLVTWIRDAARALAYSHAQGVIHRDIKPSNLLVDRAGGIHIGDFGLARRVEDASSLTTDGSVLGTPAYMSPEQAAGRTAEIGPASDQYSLGIVLYEILTGRVPFRGNVQQVLQKVANLVPPPPRALNPSVPVELDAICQRALAHQPGQRYPDLEAFADDLDRWLQLRAQASQRLMPGSGVSRKTLMWIGGAGSLACLLLIGACLMSLDWGGSGDGSGDEELAGPPLPHGSPFVPQPNGMDIVQDAAGPSGATDVMLAARRELLLAASAPNRSWEGTLPGGASAGQPFTATFIEQDKAAGTVQVLVADADDFGRRTLWNGALELQSEGFGASATSNWAIVLRPDGEPEIPATYVREMVVVADGEQGLVWKNLPEPVRLAAAARPVDIPTVAELKAQLEEWAVPGSVWEGTLQESGEASRYVRLTFTASRDEGQHVRAILESVDSPFVMAPFIGTIDWSPAKLLAGTPISLTREERWMGYSDEWRVFQFNWTPLLLLSIGTDELVGVAGTARVRLKPGKAIADPLPRAEQWRKAITPGAIWSGALKFGDDPPTRVRVTIAEVREDGSYVRLLAEDQEDPQRFAIYEGAVDVSDAAVDGYALSLNSVMLPARGVLERRFGLFPIWEDGKHSMRLSADGGTLYCRTQEGEQLVLTREADDAPLPLDRASFAEAWKEVCKRGPKWDGSVLNTEFDQRGAVRLEFVSGPDALGNIGVALSIPDMPRAKISYQGTLTLDSDVAVNGFALKLRKMEAGIGNSVLFGQAQDVELHLRLSEDGTRLIGMAGVRNRGWTEFVEITRPGVGE